MVRRSLPFRAAMEGGRATALWLVLVASAIVSASSSGEASANGQPATPTGPDTNVLCVSNGGGYPSLPSPTGQGKGGRPSNYYYFFTAAGSRSSCAGASAYALVLLVLVSVVANLQ
ncbi:hypothetical protein SETIT_7G295800v2 [Setaria italica]|uniref:Uncharacterized protein n=1 Tax=Setaria italica TaxID=4555 RepID=A0A368S174_SETIT|nr:hypothetical protein SETIT_7G295800v2 [Setaria italica]